jgi:hypothetical protein
MALPAIVTSSNFPDALERGLRAVIFNDFAYRTKEFEPLFNVRGSEKYRERDLIQAGLGQLEPRGEGQAPPFDAGVEAWVATYIHQIFMLGIKITKVAQSDELYGIVGKYGGEVSDAAAYTQEVQGMNVFNNLGATIYTPLETGTAYTLLATNHYRVDGGTYSNKLASGADLTRESLELALIQWHNQMMDLRGRKTAVPAARLVVGPSDQMTAHRLLESMGMPGTDNNDPNVIKRFNLELHVMTHLTDDGRWFLLGPKEKTCLNWFNRWPITVERETAGDGSGNLLITVSGRWTSGASAPFNILGSA